MRNRFKSLIAAGGAVCLTTACQPTASQVDTPPTLDAKNYSGVWVMDADRSSWSDGTMPKGMSLSIDLDFQDDKVVYVSSNDTCFKPGAEKFNWCAKATKPYSVSYTAGYDEQPVPASNPANHYDTITIKKFNENDYEVRKSKGDKIITAEYWTFTPDGKEFIRKGMAIKSNHTYVEYFSRK